MSSHVTTGGQLAADIDNIVFCSASTRSTAVSHERPVDSDGSPSPKRHKYTSYAPPRVPVSSSSVSPTNTNPISAPENVPSSSTSTSPNRRAKRAAFSTFSYLLFLYLFILCSSSVDTLRAQAASEITHEDPDTTTGRVAYSDEEAYVQYIFS